MKIHFSTACAALSCLLLASCYPYKENPGKKPAGKPPEKTVTSEQQQKIKEQRNQLANEADTKKKVAEDTASGSGDTGSSAGGSGGTSTTTVDEKRTDYAFANKVPGKEGFVFSPYNNKIVDVRDIPSGTLVQDPTYTGAGKGYFRVP